VKIQRTERRKPIIPINSMSDIAFLLLIFIMLISLINYRKEVKIAYPEAEHYEVTQAEKNLEIWITKDGNIIIDGMLHTPAMLEDTIAAHIIENPSVRIHVLADRDTPYMHVNQVIEILKLLQHRVVSMVVKETDR
jgi:biopolymer transport protein ExbD